MKPEFLTFLRTSEPIIRPFSRAWRRRTLQDGGSLKSITCPHEMVAMSAAHGYAQATGRGQAVLVHVDVGTQSLGGAVHNAAKGRVPVLLFAGISPITQEGELLGSRNEWVHWVQDVLDQRGIVRGYVKYDNEIRTGRNIKQIVHRAMQIAHSDPKGPVYLTAAREVLDEEVPTVAANDPKLWQPVAPGAIEPSAAALIAEDLMAARRPLVISSYLGRNPAGRRRVGDVMPCLGHRSVDVRSYLSGFPG